MSADRGSAGAPATPPPAATSVARPRQSHGPDGSDGRPEGIHPADPTQTHGDATTTEGLERGPDGITRCWWCGSDSLSVRYHDLEWGRPVADDDRLFEKLCLEGFQAGLSWLTILRKREGFRAAFAGFGIDAVASFGPADVDRLLADAGIVRHRAKIESAIGNAGRARSLRDERGSLAAYLWSFAPPLEPAPAPWSIPSTTPESLALSKDLKRQGWTFVGPTTMYAFMQAVGMVNDHVEGCHHRPLVEEERARFVVPS